MREANPKKSPIGLWTLVALVVANMIGTGLYFSSQYTLARLGDARLVLVVWLLGGIMAMCGAVAYGALARRLPLSGGEYLYLSRLIHPSVGFMAGWISLIAGFTAPIAMMAIVVGKYSLPDSWNNPTRQNLVACGVIALGTLCHAIHLKAGAWFQNLIVALKVFCLLWFLVLAFTFGPEGGWQSGILIKNPMANASWSAVVGGVLGSLVWISLSYTGFNAGVYLAGELPRGSNILPRSMWMATLLVAVLYVALNAVFLYAIPAEKIISNERYVSEAARAIGSRMLESLIRVAIILSSGTSVLAMLMAGPRVYAQMAQDGFLPKLFATRKQLPRAAILIQAVLSTIVVWIAKLQDLIFYLGLTLSACGALAIASIWWIHRKIPDAEPIRWYEHISAAIFLAFTLVLLVAAYFEQPIHLLACGITFAVGGLVYGVLLLLKR